MLSEDSEDPNQMAAAWEAKKDIYSLVQDIAPKGTEFLDDIWGAGDHSMRHIMLILRSTALST